MPICKCCNGWYDEDQEDCGRCHSSTAEWEFEEARSLGDALRDYFANIWGLLSLATASFPVLALALLPYIVLLSEAVSDLFYANLIPILLSQFFTLILSLLIIAVIYGRRLALREYELIRQAGTAERLSLTALAVIALGALLLLAGIAVILPFLPLEAITIPLAFLFLVPYPISIAAFVIFFMLLATANFIGHLNERLPLPIYLKVNELIALVIDSAKRRLDMDCLELTSMGRTEQGGVRMAIKGEQEVLRKSDDEEKSVIVKIGKKWKVEANRWGELTLIEEIQTR